MAVAPRHNNDFIHHCVLKLIKDYRRILRQKILIFNREYIMLLSLVLGCLYVAHAQDSQEYTCVNGQTLTGGKLCYNLKATPTRNY